MIVKQEELSDDEEKGYLSEGLERSHSTMKSKSSMMSGTSRESTALAPYNDDEDANPTLSQSDILINSSDTSNSSDLNEECCVIRSEQKRKLKVRDMEWSVWSVQTK